MIIQSFESAPRLREPATNIHDLARRALTRWPSTARMSMSGFGLALQNLPTTVKAIGANVVTQMNFPGGRLDRGSGHIKCVVRPVHAALGRGLLVLLNCHDVAPANLKIMNA
jgi:hypothetical protein